MLCYCVFLHTVLCMCDSLGHSSEGQLHIQSRFSTRLHEGHSKLLHREMSVRSCVRLSYSALLYVFSCEDKKALMLTEKLGVRLKYQERDERVADQYQ